ncbi:MAG TPA: helix-turn-helix transcriptional regulator [Bacillota bacterium]|nr:helix-turn-helix transcriptional regulator [Bacillota bacterium]
MPRPASPDGYPTMCLALLAEGPAHGYDLVARLAERTGAAMRLPAGLVYPILHGLEGEALVKAEWAEGEQGRRRRVYTLTERGRHVLAERTAQWERHRRAVDRVLLGGWGVGVATHG